MEEWGLFSRTYFKVDVLQNPSEWKVQREADEEQLPLTTDPPHYRPALLRPAPLRPAPLQTHLTPAPPQTLPTRDPPHYGPAPLRTRLTKTRLTKTRLTTDLPH